MGWFFVGAGVIGSLKMEKHCFQAALVLCVWKIAGLLQNDWAKIRQPENAFPAFRLPLITHDWLSYPPRSRANSAFTCATFSSVNSRSKFRQMLW